MVIWNYGVYIIIQNDDFFSTPLLANIVATFAIYL